MGKKNRTSRPSTRSARSAKDARAARASARAAELKAAKAEKAKAAKAKKRQRIAFVDRPFAGIPGEADLVAMREIIPAATAPITLNKEHGGHELLLVTLLPNQLPAVRREDGVLLVAVQTAMRSGDASRDIADIIERAVDLADGESLTLAELPEAGPRLQDMLADGCEITVEVHQDFGYWVAEDKKSDPQVVKAIEESREQLVPMRAVPDIKGAYWCDMGKEYVRFAREEDESDLVDAMARLAAKRELSMDIDGEEARCIGTFRGCGILVPVWEIPAGTGAEGLTKPMAALSQRLKKALVDQPLNADERRAKAGVISRQLTLR